MKLLDFIFSDILGRKPITDSQFNFLLPSVTPSHIVAGRMSRSKIFSQLEFYGPACRLRDQYTTCSDITMYCFILNIYKNNVAQT